MQLIRPHPAACQVTACPSANPPTSSSPGEYRRSSSRREGADRGGGQVVSLPICGQMVLGQLLPRNCKMRMTHARTSTSQGDTPRNPGQGRPWTQPRAAAWTIPVPLAPTSQPVPHKCPCRCAPAKAEGTLVTPWISRIWPSATEGPLSTSFVRGGCGPVL